MPKTKISISIETVLLNRLKAVMEYENRPSVSNVIESSIDLGKYQFAINGGKMKAYMK